MDTPSLTAITPPFAGKLSARIQTELQPGEPILWSGRPEFGAQRRDHFWEIMLLCLVAWVFLPWLLLYCLPKNLLPAADQSSLSALLSALVYWFVILPMIVAVPGILIWIWQWDKDVAYVITGKRALIFTQRMGKISTSSFVPGRLLHLAVKKSPHGCGSILFKEDADARYAPGGSDLPVVPSEPAGSAMEVTQIGFLNLADPAAVLGQLRQLRGAMDANFPVKYLDAGK